MQHPVGEGSRRPHGRPVVGLAEAGDAAHVAVPAVHWTAGADVDGAAVVAAFAVAAAAAAVDAAAVAALSAHCEAAAVAVAAADVAAAAAAFAAADRGGNGVAEGGWDVRRGVVPWLVAVEKVVSAVVERPQRSVRCLPDGILEGLHLGRRMLRCLNGCLQRTWHLFLPYRYLHYLIRVAALRLCLSRLMKAQRAKEQADSAIKPLCPWGSGCLCLTPARRRRCCWCRDSLQA